MIFELHISLHMGIECVYSRRVKKYIFTVNMAIKSKLVSQYFYYSYFDILVSPIEN